MEILQFLILPFVASLILTGIHAYLGVHVVERGVIFVDLALAQIAALGKMPSVFGGLLRTDAALNVLVHVALPKELQKGLGLALDEGIGRVMEALRTSGQLENTLVVFAADQGFGMEFHETFRDPRYDRIFNEIKRPNL